jgi:predicted nucleic acid-binding Zn ribbon protein
MKSLADMMGAVLKQTGSAGAMRSVWARVVGEVVAKHTRPVRWEGKTLVIRCDGEAWRAALEPERGQLARKLAAATGESSVLAIVLEVGSPSSPPRGEGDT